MADNVIANTSDGGGATFATDQSAGGVHYPLTKLVWGPLDTFTLVDTVASALPIQDGGNSITVDGTVAATQSGAWNIGTVSTVTSITQFNGQAIAMGTGVRSAGTQRVTIATDDIVPASQSGTWTVQPGNTANTTAWMVGHGKTPKMKTGSASATFTIVAAVASKKIKVYSLSLLTSSTTAVTVTFKDAAGGTAIATYLLQAISGTVQGITENISIPSHLFETAAGNLLEMSFSGAVSVTYNLRYWDDDAA